MGDQMRSAPEMMKALENFHIQAGFKLFVMITRLLRRGPSSMTICFAINPDHMDWPACWQKAGSIAQCALFTVYLSRN